jgi:hypothetical protein
VIRGPSASVRPGVPAIALGTGLIHGALGGSIGTMLLNASVASAASGYVASNGGSGTATVGESGRE